MQETQIRLASLAKTTTIDEEIVVGKDVLELVAGAIVSVVFALPSALTSPECFASGAPCACCGAAGEPCGAAVGASFAVGAFIGAAVSAFGETAAGDSAPLAPP